jgi:hypothetical protein
MVGPESGKEAASVTDAAALSRMEYRNSFRRAILTITSIQRVMGLEGVFQKSSRQTSTNFGRKASRSGDLSRGCGTVCLGRRFVTAAS